MSGSHGPAAVAMELLGEITQPVLRDLKVEFRGLRTARVYPDPLPNLPLGTQQIILGRYMPQGEDQSGEVIVTGTLGGKPVRFTAKVSLKDAEAGNSFIPRLWARMHLDALLEQGASQAVKDEIIALSEEYHIITPVHVAPGLGERRRPRAVRREAALPDARRREVLRRRPRKRQLGTDPAADEAAGHLAAGAAPRRAPAARPRWAATLPSSQARPGATGLGPTWQAR